MRWLAPRPTPNLKGQGFSVGVSFKSGEYSPFATVTQLLRDEDGQHMTSLVEPMLDGEAFPNIYEDSIGNIC